MGADEDESPPFVDVNPLHRVPLVFVNLLVFAVSCVVAFACIMSIVERRDEISFRRRSLLVSFVVNRDITALCISSLLMVIGFMGFVGGLRENVCFLRWYMRGACLLVVLDLLYVGATVALPMLTKSTAQSVFTIELVVSYRDNRDYARLVDFAQSAFHCCGVTSDRYRDWGQNLYFNCSKTNPSVERCSVPASCCRPPEGHDIDTRLKRRFCGSGVLAGTEQEAWNKIYTRSCVDAFQSYVKSHTILMVGVGLVIFVVIAVLRHLAVTVHDQIISLTHLYERYYRKLDHGYPERLAHREVLDEVGATDKRLVVGKKRARLHDRGEHKLGVGPQQPFPRQDLAVGLPAQQLQSPEQAAQGQASGDRG
ncbi:tetraspanin-33-like [Dermacentor albipictus]|uniref:tetraspanin-33-like n=1 Tax=Dermacentor albipictus TaxID=60249 RepID=UPI0038FCE1A7